jgi:ATP-dependent Clp protease ATP-binding subunit ClpA
VLEHALRESVRLGHSYVGTGHLAPALMTVTDGMATETLRNPGLDYGRLRTAVTGLAPAVTEACLGDAAPSG